MDYGYGVGFINLYHPHSVMGTRSVTTIEEEGKPLLKIYRQYDGYIEGGLGEELIDFLRGRRVVNGYNQQDKEDRAFNGLGCLAASIVAYLKEGIGNVYIQALDDDYEGSYNYFISVPVNGGQIYIRMEGYEGVIYDGPVNDFVLEDVVEE
jgi:hypothetical protein